MHPVGHRRGRALQGGLHRHGARRQAGRRIQVSVKCSKLFVLPLQKGDGNSQSVFLCAFVADALVIDAFIFLASGIF
jgi:hypothetical protein